MDDAVVAAEGKRITLSESAARRVIALIEQEHQDGLMLRVTVSGGGCSGFQYGFVLDDTVNADDVTFERDGARLVVDEVSLELLAGSEIDFIEDLMGAYFSISNPNATSSCGCGSSFSI